MHVRFSCVVLLLGLVPSSALAALTLEEALVRAEEVSTALRLQELSGEVAIDSWLSDPRAGAPSIRVGLRDLDPDAAADPPEWTARLRFPFPRPWEIATAARQGRATAAREDAELQALRLDLRSAVATRVRALPLLRDAAAAATRLMELRERHLELVQERRAEGLSSALDWLESEEERRDSDDDRAAREADALDVEADLRRLLGWAPEEALEFAEFDAVAAAEAVMPTEEELLAGLLAGTPRVEEALAQVERSEARLARQRFQSLPWLDWAQGGAVFRSGRAPTFEVGIAIDVPTYHWSGARTREARHELARSKLELANAERIAREDVIEQLRSLAAATERWQVERTHHAAVSALAAPLLEVADPLLVVELEARLVRAELRELLALAEVMIERERLAYQ